MIGERIRVYRLSKGAKVGDFAKLIGVSQGSLSDIENQKTKPSADTISALVRHTDIDARWLLTGEGIAPEKRVNPVIDRIDKMLIEMPEDAQRDVLKYTEEKKLLSEFLGEKHGRKTG